eukprot:m.129104 g.129104  ORF g.129104 m.129104 type:complete len:966 (+) comp23622_c0_seq5:40-2937(+)
MESLRRAISGVKNFYQGINPATLSGAIDIVVVRMPDGTLKSSPFHVRFGKLSVLRTSEERVVDISVNEIPIKDLKMKIGEAGEAFFVHEAEGSEVPEYLCTSPIPTNEHPSHFQRSASTTQVSDLKSSQESSASEKEALPTAAEASRYSIVSDTESEPPLQHAEGEQEDIFLWEWGDLPVSEGEQNKGWMHKIQGLFKPKLPPRSEGGVFLSDLQPREDIEAPVVNEEDVDADEMRNRNDQGENREVQEEQEEQEAQEEELFEDTQTVLVSEEDHLNLEAIEQDSMLPAAEPDVALVSTSLVSEQQFQPNNTNKDSRSKNNNNNKNNTKADYASKGKTRATLTPISLSQHNKGITKTLAQQHGVVHNTGPHARTISMSSSQASLYDDNSIRSSLTSSPNSLSSPTSTRATLASAALQRSRSNDILPQQPYPSDDDDATPMAVSAPGLTVPRSSRRRCISEPPGSDASHDASLFNQKLADLWHQNEADVELGEQPHFPASMPGSPRSRSRTRTPITTRAKSSSPFRSHKQQQHGKRQGRRSYATLDEHQKDKKVKQRDIALSLCGPLDDLMTGAEKERLFNKHVISHSDFVKNPFCLSDANVMVRIQNNYYTWTTAAPVIMSVVAFHKELPQAVVDELSSRKPAKKETSTWSSWIWRTKDRDDTASSIASSVISDSDKENKTVESSLIKTLFLTSDELKSLNLKDGANMAEFSVTTKLQGRSVVRCAIFVWNWNDKVVVSDIDGTITRSDVMGHAAALFGTDWTHVGVANLFSAIAKNGYKFLYLSSRSISHARVTRGYLKGIHQKADGFDEVYTLPDGPVLLSPSSFMASLRREVIERTPQVFKISCLKNIRELFPPDVPPFTAGFGNRITDEVSYKAVGISENRIFTIDPSGDVKLAVGSFKSSYQSLGDIVDFMFPTINGNATWSRGETKGEYDDFRFWQSPLPEVRGGGEAEQRRRQQQSQQ